MISPQQQQYSQTMKQEKGLSLEILSDPGNRTARQYGLVYTLPDDLIGVYRSFGIDLPLHNGDESWTLPMPARLVIDGQGKVRYTAISADYTVRPEPADTLEALRKIVTE